MIFRYLFLKTHECIRISTHTFTHMRSNGHNLSAVDRCVVSREFAVVGATPDAVNTDVLPPRMTTAAGVYICESKTERDRTNKPGRCDTAPNNIYIQRH